MTIKEMMAKFGALKIDEMREESEGKAEFVVFNDEMSSWSNVFVGIFGPALKPLGAKPTNEHLDLARPYGGIFDTQVLYKKDFEGYYALAMFWPWGDKIHTTIKLAVVKK